MGYYRDRGVGAIADNSVFPATTAWAKTPSAWRDGTLDAVAAPGRRTDLGYYMNTSNIGDPGAPIQQAMTGTHYGNILYGVTAYLNSYGLVGATVNNYSDLNGPAAPYDTTGIPGPHTVPLSYARIQTEINAGRPVLLHLSYWNLLNRQRMQQGGWTYDQALWGSQVSSGPGGEEYSSDIGHTVTVVGYWNSNDPTNPFIGLGNGGSTPDAVVVHDNTDGTLAGLVAASLPLVLPYSFGQQNPGLNVPWVMQTEIMVPEPVQTGWLLGVGTGVFVLLRRRYSKRNG
jgi:hypothetical protein